MKIFSVLVLVVISFTIVQSQSKTENISISAGYYSQLLIQPGFKTGVSYSFKKWEKNKESHTLYQSLFVNPHLGIFSRVNNNTNFTFGTDVGFF